MQRPRGIATKAFEAYGFRESECGGVALARARCTNRSVGRQTVLSCVRCCALWHRLRVRDFGWCGDWGVVIVECVVSASMCRMQQRNRIRPIIILIFY